MLLVTTERADFDVVLVGGGLASGLVALALATQRPDWRVAVVDRRARGASPVVSHTWSFHDADVPDAAVWSWLRPTVEASWPGYDVWFPEGSPTEGGGGAYHTITQARFDAAVDGALAAQSGTWIRGEATALTTRRASLSDGRVLEARLVLDARGPQQLAPWPAQSGYQKFVGVEVELAAPCGLQRPLLMDATVPQLDGYRFVYTLPLSPTRVLIEDTMYADGPALDVDYVAERAHAYARGRGWRVLRELRREVGVLPLPWGPATADDSDRAAPRIGYAGNWFHATTGYSLPVGLRIAALVAGASRATLADDVRTGLATLRAVLAPQQRFFRLLNRLLFTAVAPEERWRIFARFYGLPAATVARFYALRTTRADRLRVLCGRIPRGLSVTSALFREATA